MPEHWTVARIASRLHRKVFEPLGFHRQGNTCVRSDGPLLRTIRFYGLASTSPQVQMLAQIRLVGLPEPVTQYRHDSLWGAPKRTKGKNSYLRPRSDEDLPPELVADVSGPAVDFLLEADGLGEFVLWAQRIYLGDQHPGWWGQFQPVLPQGTGPLQAAAYAALLSGDKELTDFLARRVANDEASEHYLADFQTELGHANSQ